MIAVPLFAKPESVKFNSFFPTLIYQAAVTAKASALTKELRREAAILAKIDAHGAEWSKENYQRGFTTYGSMDKLHETSPTFQELEKKLDRHVKAFARKQQWDLDGGRLKQGGPAAPVPAAEGPAVRRRRGARC